MGRKRKYYTLEEKKKANNDKVKQFYWQNKEVWDKNARAYYWIKKIKFLLTSGNIEGAVKVRDKALSKGIDRDKFEFMDSSQ